MAELDATRRTDAVADGEDEVADFLHDFGEVTERLVDVEVLVEAVPEN